MNVVLEREKLLQVLSKINASFSSKNNLFASSAVLFEFLDKKLRVSATDLELSLSAEIAITNTQRVSICIPFKKVFMLIKELNSPHLEIEIAEEKMSIRCENCEYNLNGFSKEKFPKISIPKDRIAIKFDSQILAEMIDLTKFCVFIGETNYVLAGILLELEKNEIKMVATDGKRLAFCYRKIPPFQPELNRKISVIVPLRAINEVRRLLGGEVILVAGSNQIEFNINNVQVITQLIEGEYPEYNKYIPAESENKLKVKREDFLSSLRRVSILTTPDYPGVKMSIEENNLVISKHIPNLGSLKEELNVEYSGPNITFGFNPQYLIDVLKVLNKDTVEFDIYGSESAVVVRETGYIYLALPMKLD